MTARALVLGSLDVGVIDLLLCDADGTLFESEQSRSTRPRP